MPAARLISLRAQPGGSAACVLVLERLTGAWSDQDLEQVSATNGELTGSAGGLPGSWRFGQPTLAGPALLLLPLSIVVDPAAPAGRYKAPLAVRHGTRLEPLALLLEVGEER